jgi:hypothetical protein
LQILTSTKRFWVGEKREKGSDRGAAGRKKTRKETKEAKIDGE